MRTASFYSRVEIWLRRQPLQPRVMQRSPKEALIQRLNLKVIDCTSTHSISDTACHFGIDRKRLREWKKQREELQALPSKKKRLEGGGRKAALPSIEEEVVLWIDEM